VLVVLGCADVEMIKDFDSDVSDDDLNDDDGLMVFFWCIGLRLLSGVHR
jgi:hypothetical protein